MSNAGRPALPTWVKELRGTLQPGDRDSEPRPDEAIYVPPPAEIRSRPVACEFWQSHLPLLVKNRMITEVDMAQFALLCLAFEDLIEADEELRTNGKTQRTENGYLVQSPWVSFRDQAWKRYVEMCREFGLTPSSRSKVKIQIIGGAPHNAIADEHQTFFEF
jgi:P27 family predicted phage terminase small subunit